MITKTEEVEKITFDLSKIGVGDIIEFKYNTRLTFSGWRLKLEWGIVAQVTDEYLWMYARRPHNDTVEEIVLAADQAGNIRITHRHPSNV